MINLYKSLLKAQQAINFAIKDSKNPHFKSNYESLESVIEAIKEPLNNNGIVIVHVTDVESKLTTKLIHVESGEFIESTVPLITMKNDMQQLGSAMTYAKRQNLKNLTNLPSEDDDGNSASIEKISQKTSYNTAPKVYHQPPKDTSNPADFVIDLGPKSKLSGTSLKDHDPSFLTNELTRLNDWYSKIGKEPHENVIKFSNALDLYIKSITK